MLTREQVDPEVRSLWDECERTYPAFRHLWATQAHSPIVFRHLWGQLLELKRRSPVEARHFGRLMARLQEHFSEQQIEELTWRIVQCVAFNWHNDFLELVVEPGVAPREAAAAAGRA
jgi:hypothetical protein